MDVHIEATGFNARAADYEKGRPSYPPEAVQWLVSCLAIGPGATVVDLAAGTGKLTRLLVGTGATVVAVEPMAGMRAVLAEQVPGVEVLEGTAEQLPLPEGSASAITVAQAFHWFRGDEALAEAHRALGGAGRLGLVWNVRDLGDPLQAALEQVMGRYRGDSPSEGTGRWREAFERTTLFSPLDHRCFSFRQELTPPELVARVLSVSFMARLPDEEQQRVAAEVAALAPGPGPVALPYKTDVYWCQAEAGRRSP